MPRFGRIEGMPASRRISKWRSFGQYWLDFPKLIYENKIVLKFKSATNFIEFSGGKEGHAVSPIFSSIIVEILEKHTFNRERMNELPMEEQKFMCDLLVKSHLATDLGFDISRLVYLSGLCEKFNLTKSAIIAGNDNPLLVVELKQLMCKLVKEELMSQEDMEEFIECLNTMHC